jgi:pimeloyl-ACP methyl ester carboxylesterase
MKTTLTAALGVLAACAGAALIPGGAGGSSPTQASPRNVAAGPVITTVYPALDSRGLMVTSGGWAYCGQIRPIARQTQYTLLCGRYYKDQYLGPGLRAQRHLDWGDPLYLRRFAENIRDLHQRVGGKLILIGVSYSGFGVATLASHHPEMRPDRLIVVDSYLDLLARRKRLPGSHETAREIDEETGGSEAALRQRNVSVEGLAWLVREGVQLTVIWSVSDEERRFFRGATCNREANAETLAQLARTLRRPISAWVTQSQHGHDLWGYGVRIVRGHNPGREVVFRPTGPIPEGAVC